MTNSLDNSLNMIHLLLSSARVTIWPSANISACLAKCKIFICSPLAYDWPKFMAQ